MDEPVPLWLLVVFRPVLGGVVAAVPVPVVLPFEYIFVLVELDPRCAVEPVELRPFGGVVAAVPEPVVLPFENILAFVFDPLCAAVPEVLRPAGGVVAAVPVPLVLPFENIGALPVVESAACTANTVAMEKAAAVVVINAFDNFMMYSPGVGLSKMPIGIRHA